MNNYLVLLFYKYIHLDDIELLKDKILSFGKKALKGRILIAVEGINGTLSGLEEDCKTFQLYLEYLGIKGIEYKVDKHNKHCFPKWIVKTRIEIVKSTFPEISPNNKTGIHLTPQQFYKMKQKENTCILDVRSNYEHKLGKFKDAITVDINYFRDFHKRAKELSIDKSKKILTYCTGGIKCEKASRILLDMGYKNVYQLHGGIIKYGKEMGGKDFDGKCYVFDDRLSVEVNTVNRIVVGKCHRCKNESENITNCKYPRCNNHVIICKKCCKKFKTTCCNKCKLFLEITTKN